MVLKRLSILGTMILAACVPASGPGRDMPSSYYNKVATKAETNAWRAAQRTNTPSAYRAFINSYPRSRYVPAATDRIKSMTKRNPFLPRTIGAGREGGGREGGSRSY